MILKRVFARLARMMTPGQAHTRRWQQPHCPSVLAAIHHRPLPTTTLDKARHGHITRAPIIIMGTQAVAGHHGLTATMPLSLLLLMNANLMPYSKGRSAGKKHATFPQRHHHGPDARSPPHHHIYVLQSFYRL